jgi:hypothetical protein
MTRRPHKIIAREDAKVLRFVVKHPKCARSELAKALRMDDLAATNALVRLRKGKHLRMSGSKRGARWRAA